jgi:hypothetical protein
MPTQIGENRAKKMLKPTNWCCAWGSTRCAPEHRGDCGGVDAAGMDPIIARARERGRYPHDFVSVSDHLGSIRRVGLQNN